MVLEARVLEIVVIGVVGTRGIGNGNVPGLVFVLALAVVVVVVAVVVLVIVVGAVVVG